MDSFRYFKGNGDKYTDITYFDYIKAIMIGVCSTLSVSALVILFAWLYYAYNNPTSTSGIWLIEVSGFIDFEFIFYNKV